MYGLQATERYRDAHTILGKKSSSEISNVVLHNQMTDMFQHAVSLQDRTVVGLCQEEVGMSGTWWK